MANILLVEDEIDAALQVKRYLECFGFEVTAAHDGYSGLLAVEKHKYDLVITDRVMPKIDGLHLCRLLRSRETYTPVIMMSALSDLEDRLGGFEAGVDDYLCKPVDCDELLAKVNALLRLVDNVNPKKEPSSGRVLRAGPLTLDLEKHLVTRDGKNIKVTPREFSLLCFLARSPGKVFSRSQLLKNAWDYKHDYYTHTVDSHINRLRNKIEEDPAKPKILQTVWGAGYKISDGS